jgi:hypothetical protein
MQIFFHIGNNVKRKKLFATVANLKYSSNMIGNVTGRRPDYKVDVYRTLYSKYCNVYGECKPDNSQADDLIKDLYRIAVFTKIDTEENELEHSISFKSINNRIIFYVMVKIGGIFCMSRLFDVVIPTTLSDFTDIRKTFDTAYNLRRIYQTFCLKKEQPLTKPKKYSPTLPWGVVENLVASASYRGKKRVILYFSIFIP